MKKRLFAAFLALTMALSLLPVSAFAAQDNLPDWYFLFAIFKNIDADGKDKDGVATHVTYSMSQQEVDVIRVYARQFEEYMSQVGVMRAHVEVVEIDATLKELQNRDSGGSYIAPNQAAPLLQTKVDLDRYDHVTCFVGLDNLVTRYVGVTGATYENGTGNSCANIGNRASCLKDFEKGDWFPSLYVHEFLHFMEHMSRKWGVNFDEHSIGQQFYMPNKDS